MKNIIDQLIAFFEKNGFPFDLNENKIWEKITISKDTYNSGWKVIEIERHRGKFGGNFVRGVTMTGLQTYWMRYEIQKEKGEVRKLPEKVDDGSIELTSLVEEHLDYGQFDKITIELYGEKDYEMEYSIECKKRIISTMIQAISFGLESVPGFCEWFDEELDLINFSEDFVDELSLSYKKLLEDEITHIIMDKWEKAQKMRSE